MAQPNNVSMAVEHLAKLVDDMWYLADDKSADVRYNHIGAFFYSFFLKFM